MPFISGLLFSISRFIDVISRLIGGLGRLIDVIARLVGGLGRLVRGLGRLIGGLGRLIGGLGRIVLKCKCMIISAFLINGCLILKYLEFLGGVWDKKWKPNCKSNFRMR